MREKCEGYVRYGMIYLTSSGCDIKENPSKSTHVSLMRFPQQNYMAIYGVPEWGAPSKGIFFCLATYHHILFFTITFCLFVCQGHPQPTHTQTHTKDYIAEVVITDSPTAWQPSDCEQLIALTSSPRSHTSGGRARTPPVHSSDSRAMASWSRSR